MGRPRLAVVLGFLVPSAGQKAPWRFFIFIGCAKLFKQLTFRHTTDWASEHVSDSTQIASCEYYPAREPHRSSDPEQHAQVAPRPGSAPQHVDRSVVMKRT